MNVHIYIDAEDFEQLNNLVRLLSGIIDGCDHTPIQYYTTPKAYKSQDNIIEVSLSSENFVELTDRDVLKKIELIQN
jgi:hypothetical protein